MRSRAQAARPSPPGCAGRRGATPRAISARLLIPVLALIALILAGVDNDDIWFLALVGVCALVGAGAVAVLALKSEDFTRRFGEWIGKYVSALLVRFNREPVPELGDKAVSFRARVGSAIRRRWPLATVATLASHVFRLAILPIWMRAVGVSASQVDVVTLLAADAVVKLLMLIPLTPGASASLSPATRSYSAARPTPTSRTRSRLDRS